MPNGSEQKAGRTIYDRFALWISAGLLVLGGIAFFDWVHDLRFPALWKLTLMLNVPFVSLLIWRLWSWIRNWPNAVIFLGFVALHLLAFIALVLVGLPLLAWVVLFPLEAWLLVVLSKRDASPPMS